MYKEFCYNVSRSLTLQNKSLIITEHAKSNLTITDLYEQGGYCFTMPRKIIQALESFWYIEFHS